MKRNIAVILVFVCMVVFSGCSVVDDLLSSNDIPRDELYSKLSMLAAYPEDVEDSDLTGKEVTFTTMIVSEVTTFNFEEDKQEQRYIYACISRNMEKPILLNIEKVDTVPEIYDIVTVHGKVQGYVYGTDENEQIQVLDIEVLGIEKAVNNAKASNTDTIQIIGTEGAGYKGKFEFVKTVFAKNSFDKSAATVYFTFYNEGTEKQSPPVGRISFSQGGYLLESTIFSVEPEPDSNALKGQNGTEKTLPGKDDLYFINLISSTEEYSIVSGKPVIASFYDDDFNLISKIEIPIAE